MTVREWQDFVATRPEANFLQSVPWGEANAQVGHEIVRDVIRQGGRAVAGWQGIIKNARRGRYLEVPGAPLLDWNDAALAKEVVAQLQRVAKEQQCVFVRIRPQLLDSAAHRTLLAQVGFKKAPFHLHAEHTNILDLTKSEDELLAGMRRQTRYEVRRSAKQGITVTASATAAAVQEFYEVQADTARRQGFVPSSHQFLRQLVESFGGSAMIYRAEKDGQLLNLALVLSGGEEADYFEAASTPESRQYAGAYGLQWQAIQDARAAGKTRYNFWGIAYSTDPNHRYAGVTTFKRGFGGQDVTYVPAHDLIINPLKYTKNWLIETIRRKQRKL